jgi:hypothetical protein
MTPMRDNTDACSSPYASYAHSLPSPSHYWAWPASFSAFDSIPLRQAYVFSAERAKGFVSTLFLRVALAVRRPIWA